MWGGGGVGEKIKISERGPQNFPFRPPLRISNGIAINNDLMMECSLRFKRPQILIFLGTQFEGYRIL